jgi:PAS domain-containing protein
MERLQKLSDLTEQLTVRDSILKSTNAKLNLAMDLCHIGVWDLDINSGALEWDSRMVDIFGKNVSTYEEFLDCVHDDDRDRVHKAVSHSLNTSIPYNLKYKINTPTETKRIHARGKVVNNTDGKRFIGVCVVLWGQ